MQKDLYQLQLALSPQECEIKNSKHCESLEKLHKVSQIVSGVLTLLIFLRGVAKTGVSRGNFLKFKCQNMFCG